ncbi:hypothetical protein NBRC116188_11500 [Oceaniserpentilla sp. 4NH20-0058]|uniref:RluA family pseudouridine synthase n=1 Tax=Oceaniserpentilla sp. 4NH20-0058 TaxID=3127660 RepID=UPI003104F440
MDANFQFTVNQTQQGLTLLECLPLCIPYLQPNQCRSLLVSGGIKINSGVVFDDQLLKLEDVVSYTVPNYEEAPVDTRWRLLWENDEIAAVHKPANLPVSRTTRNVYNTLIQLLRRESSWPDAHLLHRLDLETSGVILIAKDNTQAKRFQPTLSSLMIRKIYHAIVHGEPSWQNLHHQSYLNTRKDSAIRCQMHPVKEGEGKLSETLFNVISSHNGYSIVECELLTGRKHQIRAHLSQLGHPIVGDKIYSQGGEFYLKRLDDALTQEDLHAWPTDHHMLHAYTVHLNNIWHQGGEPIVIRDTDYSKQWLAFCMMHGLSA